MARATGFWEAVGMTLEGDGLYYSDLVKGGAETYDLDEILECLIKRKSPNIQSGK